ncbi:hypothetical protein [Caulobacter sp. LARHSG274]
MRRTPTIDAKGGLPNLARRLGVGPAANTGDGGDRFSGGAADVTRLQRALEAARRLVFSFGFLHSANTGLNILFNFTQLIVFARALAPDRYAEVVVLTAAGFFLKPIDQAIGRANFIALREGAVRKTHVGKRQETVAALYAQGVFLTLVAAVLPLFIGGRAHYLENALYLFFCLYTNYWAFDLQTTAWSVDLSKRFVQIALTQRFTQFAALAALAITHSFLIFCVLICLISLAYLTRVGLLIGRNTTVLDLRLHRADLKWREILIYGRLFWSSLLSTLSELVVLSSPYALFSSIFGVGSAVVVFDSIMKIARLSMTGSRTLAEIALPRQSRMAIEGDRAGSSRIFLLVLCLCLAATAVPAAALVFESHLIFSLILGHNNRVPAQAGLVAGVIVLTSGLYQPAMFFLSFANAERQIRQLTAASVVGLGLFAAAVLVLHLALMPILWAYAAYFVLVSLLALCLFNGVHDHAVRLPQEEGQ